MNDINLTFNLSWQSEVLLKMLPTYFQGHILDEDVYEKTTVVEDLDGIVIKTFPLYNGRERGACITIDMYRSGPTLLLFFAAHRSTDSLFVWWEEAEKGFLNGPTMANFTEHSHSNQIEFFGNKFAEAAEFICEKIGEFYKARMEKAA